jgi:hypothetical protein
MFLGSKIATILSDFKAAVASWDRIKDAKSAWPALGLCMTMNRIFKNSSAFSRAASRNLACPSTVLCWSKLHYGQTASRPTTITDRFS